MKKRVLFNGCSFTADSGFTVENQQLYHWPWLLSQHYDVYFTNVAIGGSSNDEIFYRTLENLHLGKYDLCVIMWSAIGRKWAYCSTDNVDDFTNLNSGVPVGLNSHLTPVQDYAKLHYAYFNNLFVELKRWLLQIKCLHGYLSAYDQKYVFIKGFDNLVSDLDRVQYRDKEGFVDMSDNLKSICCFDNLPDYYINLKLQTLKSLLAEVKTYAWLDFDDKGFQENSCDVADDNRHPGIRSNFNLVEKFIGYFEKI